MDSGGNGDLGCENRSSGLLDCSSLGNFTPLPADEVLGTTTGSEHWNRVNSSFNSGWTPLDSVTHNIGVGTSPMSCFGSGTFSEIDNFSIPHSCRWIANSGCSGDYPSERSGDKNEKEITPQRVAGDYAISPEGEGTVKSSPDGNKRRRASDDLSQFARLKVRSNISDYFLIIYPALDTFRFSDLKLRLDLVFLMFFLLVLCV